ncbi:MAG: oleandomycin glycosyltransferase [Nannocystis sp.]|nr:oleandomycin glycosyltransferase [Nannocystis sp.]
MTDIAFFDIPYHSRLTTTLPIVRALVDRGHRVHAFTLEPYRELVAAAGAEVVIQPPFGGEPLDCTVNLRTIDYAMHAVPALVEVLQALRPALVVHTAKTLWAAVAAELCGLPTAVIHTNALMPRGARVSDAVHAARWPGRTEDELARIDARDRAAWARCADRFGLRRTHTDDVLPGIPNCMNLRGDLNLVYTSEALQPRRAEFDATYHFVGPCYDQRLADHDPGFAAELATLPGPLLYASLGSMRLYNDRGDIFSAVFEALAGSALSGVIAVGAADLGERVPPPRVLVRPYVPQLTVLERASAFITHAGTNSVFESLLAGVPMLMVPQGADQPIFAEHMEALGLGEWLKPEDCEPSRLRVRIQAILADRAVVTRVRAAGESLRQAGGITRAAELLSNFASGDTT